jgi:hypothetical protein
MWIYLNLSSLLVFVENAWEIVNFISVHLYVINKIDLDNRSPYSNRKE